MIEMLFFAISKISSGVSVCPWAYQVVIIAGIMTVLILANWQTWSVGLKCIAAMAIVLPLHVIEEWVFPGGFPWGLNDFLGSKDPMRYPGNRLYASSVNILSFVLAVPPLIWNCTPVLAVVYALFGCIECCGHLAFGVKAWFKYRAKGKETLYFPGSATAFLGFLPLGIVTFWELSKANLLSGGVWLRAVGILAVYMVFFFLLPIVLVYDKNSPYIYPRKGYFEKLTVSETAVMISENK